MVSHAELIPLTGNTLCQYSRKYKPKKSQICLWKITESLEAFDLDLIPSESSSSARNTQWLAGRAALDALDIDVAKIVKRRLW